MKKRFKLHKLNLKVQYFQRLFVLSLPVTAIFIILSLLNLMEPPVAMFCFAMVLLSNVLLIFPISSELQALRNYVQALANGQTDDLELSMAEADTRDLAQAITAVHKLWTSKADTLEAQALSDAAVLDTLPDPILMLDSEGGITNYNRAAEQLLGENISSRNIDRLFSTNIFIAAIEKVLKGKSDSESILFHAPEYNGRRFYAHITKLPHHLKGPRLFRCTMSARRSVWRKCRRILWPMPATSCVRRCRLFPALSKLCKPPRMTMKMPAMPF